MRIISGKYKGRKIIQPIDRKTRPLKDLAKESIFNLIKHSNLFKTNIENSSVLDLFSGVGSFGIECLSRGASHVVFFENYKKSLDILKKNLLILKCIEKTTISELDVFDKNNFLKINLKFDIIFIDPPFAEKRLSTIIKNIIELKLLKKRGILIIHRHKKEIDIFPINFKILLEKTYGISKIIFGNFY
tara:strand:+ start:1064 stop:1627 length:564 start_codon:yes stop_codon:yes gene_type:complete